MANVQVEKLEELRAGFPGDVLLSGDAAYESARRIWNATIDKRPAAILRCRTTEDVVRAVGLARAHQLPLAIRGGGHNIAGNAMCDDGLVVDLSAMKAVTVDAARRRATVEGGATLADVDAATQAHGLATPVGINSTTGIAGLTLGGGFGWLSRKYGLTVDNLESAEVVTATGKVLRASADEHPDLFWALRGGGGNFGVVTRFEFRLHPVGPNVLSGLIAYSGADARSVLQRYRDFSLQAPDDLTAWVVMRKAPPLPFLPADVHGREILAVAFLYAGDPDQGSPVIGPLERLGTPVGAHVGVQPYVAWQQTFDPLLAPGARNYWKSHNFATLEDGLIDVLSSYLQTLPSPHCEIFVASLGGVISRQPADATAYGQRDAPFLMNVHGRWEQQAEDDRCIRWSRDLFNATAPFASGGVYVNFMTADEGDRVRAAFGSNYERLANVKRTYDPGNVFCLNHNILPA
jgi:FAD/FMN-containing dehydrogenase